ncbi:LysR substrate-binding domain-containing protein [Jeotgalicoccus halotolerans]|uniref:DNA-binding transcriptional LysR family regulator n=1 Tax=Jeotgalicoccus halotolerans TaxID=157227 RepID=A0A3E0B2Q9_9STAP|nr:LysR substrate-binding domain-containing protein [Jeotgalicoccus halotolerans]REG26220.1 DNA-binding transcriptional LysR family regulator [Jeotgalicoccus halotolerans]
MDSRLELFLSVAENRSFSRTAEKYYMSQPAVSQHIHALEERMGTKLLDRNNKFVKLNKAGEIVYHYGKEIAALYNKMDYLVDDLTNNASGPIKIGSSYTFGEYLLPNLIAEMLRLYPHVQPDVTIGNTEEIARLVNNNQLDIGIIEGYTSRKFLVQKKFLEDSMVIVGSPGLVLKQGDSFIAEELSEYTWLMREPGSGTREANEKLFEQFKIVPGSFLTFSSTQSIKAASEAGLGLSLLSRWAIQKELKYGDLITINTPGTPLTRTFSYLKNSQYQSKVLESFTELLEQKDLYSTFFD